MANGPTEEVDTSEVFTVEIVGRRMHEDVMIMGTHVLLGVTVLDEVLHAIAQAAATLMQAPAASFWLANEATQTLEFHSCSNERAGADWPLAELSFAQGGAGWVATHRTILNVPDVFADVRIAAHHWFRAHGFQSALLAPIMLDDTLFAVLTMVRAEPFHLDADDQYVLDHLSAQAAVAIRNARLYRDSENRRRRLMTLVDVTQRLTRGLDLSTVLQAIVEAAALVFEGEASLRLLDEGYPCTRSGNVRVSCFYCTATRSAWAVPVRVRGGKRSATDRDRYGNRSTALSRCTGGAKRSMA